MTQTIETQVLAAVRSVIGNARAALHEPEFSGNEKHYLSDCIDSTFVSYIGRYVSTFERQLADYTSANEAVAVVNGTAALHIALIMAGVGAGDEVIVPGLTFVATANAVVYCDAIPHFVDCDIATLGVDVHKLAQHLEHTTRMQDGLCINTRTGRPIKALVPMHTFGHPVDIPGCQAIAARYNLALIEDAAESLGSYYDGQHTGTFGFCGVLSFNGNKVVTTGGGGALLFNDTALASRARHLTTTAKEPHTWEYRHDALGYNYRMPNVNAAIGCAQMEQLPIKLAKKRQLYERYAGAFAQVEGVRVIGERKHCQSNYWLQTLLLDEDDLMLRDTILAYCNEHGVMARPAWAPLDTLPMYRGCPASDLTNAHSLYRRLINIPSSPGLADG
jgi:perosamine synthetase